MNGLEQELVAVTGVNRAHVDVTDGEGATLHVELDDDADRDAVAAAVDVILRRHGLRSRARTVATEELEEVPASEADASGLEAPGPVAQEPEVASELPESDPIVGTEPRSEGEESAPCEAPEPQVRAVAGPARPLHGGIDEVRVAHRSGRSTVTVRTVDGREAHASSVARQDASNQAIARAVGELAEAAVPPHLVEVRHQDVGSRRAVTAVLDLGEDLVIGTSFERGSTDLGLARAIWNALTGS